MSKSAMTKASLLDQASIAKEKSTQMYCIVLLA